jgi:hypothetical protein
VARLRGDLYPAYNPANIPTDRGLHSFTFWLNVSTFVGQGCFWGVVGVFMAGVEGEFRGLGMFECQKRLMLS